MIIPGILPRWSGRAGLAIACSLMVAPAAVGQLSATQKAAIGFTSLQDRLGASMPLGIGVSASIVEAPDNGNYRLNTADAQLQGKTFQFPSGGSTGVSGHATTVGRYLFGTQSLAPRIGATVDGSTAANYEVNNWINAGFLNANNTALLPAVEPRRLVSHSWVGTFGDATTDTVILNRADYAVQRDGTIATYALNNGSGTTIPALMASTYNGIVVGLSNGNHSRGTTTVNGPGRQKPDLVVPTEFTSWATPTVSSAAGLLTQVAATTSGLGNGQRQQVVKSLLMGGATKAGPDLPGTWSWSNSPSEPLDAVYGAGQLDVEAAYDILVAGEFEAGSTLAAATGWDFGTASAATPRRYFFDVDPSLAGGSLTASLNWQRTMTATDTDPRPAFTNYVFGGSLANLDLRLYSASGFTLGGLVSQSTSTVENTELIWSTGLTPGLGDFSVGASPTYMNFATTAPAAVPEPGTWAAAALLAGGAGFMRWRKRAKVA